MDLSTRAFLLRLGALYLPASALGLAWLLRPATRRQLAGALLSTLWAFPALIAVDGLAGYLDWWQFNVEGGVLLGAPLDVMLGWALLWGALPLIAFPRLHLALLTALALVLDLYAMPLMSPLLVLHEGWLTGEAVAIILVLLPAQLLGRWVMDDTRLYARVALIAVMFTAVTFGLLPGMVLELTAGDWRLLFWLPRWLISLLLQLLAVPAIVGLSAVQEFAVRGGGTPIPYDPPKKLVTSGIYAYLANPMQTATSLVMFGWGLLLGSGWVALAGVMSVIYSVGLAAWSEGGDLGERFGEAWTEYRANVRAWLPRWRPWFPSDAPPDRMYVAEECGPCSQLALWLTERGPRNLELRAAEDHPTRALTRLTYEAAGGGPPEFGAAALARAMEHVHLGWALLGMFARLPLVRPFIQLLVDASGGEPRRVERRGLVTGSD